MNIKLTIDRFENEQAVLKLDDGATVLWPKKNLPEGTHEGAVLNFTIKTELAMEQEKKQTAKDILNEILNTEK